MRTLDRSLRGLLLLASLAFLAGDQDIAGKIVGAALVEGRAYETLAQLTDRIGPRLSGSPGYEAAVAWAVGELKRDRVDRVWTEKVLVPHWVRGVESARIVSPIDAPMAVTALGMSDPTPEGGVTGEVVEVGSFDDLKAAGEKVRGKIVLYNRPMLPNGGPEHGYGAGASLRHRGASEAAKLGAVATLIRSLGTAAFRIPHTGGMEYEEGVPHVPAAAISSEDADLIHRLLAAGAPVRVRLLLGCRTLPDVESANVLADIRGRERPDEVVVIGAHLDSWDLGQGAIDDGAGCAIVMDALRVLESLGLRPRRTIRAVLFANEENGLRGGEAYAAAHRAELAGHVAAIESDSGGARPLGIGVSAGPGAEEMLSRLASSLAALGADAVTHGGGGADISAMRSAGVPMLGLRQDTTHYFDVHHTAADTLDKLDPRDLQANVAVMAVVAYALADDPGTLPRPAPEPPPASTRHGS